MIPDGTDEVVPDVTAVVIPDGTDVVPGVTSVTGSVGELFRKYEKTI